MGQAGTLAPSTVADPVFWKGGAPGGGNRKKVVFGGQCCCAEGATMRGPKGHAN